MLCLEKPKPDSNFSSRYGLGLDEVPETTGGRDLAEDALDGKLGEDSDCDGGLLGVSAMLVLVM